MKVTGNGKLVELEETEVEAFEADERWLRFAEPHPARGLYAVYAWCMKGDPEFPGQERLARRMSG